MKSEWYFRNHVLRFLLSAMFFLRWVNVYCQQEPQLALMPQHSGAVLSLALSSDGRFLVSGGEDRYVKIWEIATGRLVYSLGPVCKQAITDAFLDRRNRRVVLSTSDGDVQVWHLFDNKSDPILEPTNLLDDDEARAALSDSELFVCGFFTGDELCIWDASSYREVIRLSIRKDQLLNSKRVVNNGRYRVRVASGRLHIDRDSKPLDRLDLRQFLQDPIRSQGARLAISVNDRRDSCSVKNVSGQTLQQISLSQEAVSLRSLGDYSFALPTGCTRTFDRYELREDDDLYYEFSTTDCNGDSVRLRYENAGMGRTWRLTAFKKEDSWSQLAETYFRGADYDYSFSSALVGPDGSTVVLRYHSGLVLFDLHKGSTKHLDGAYDYAHFCANGLLVFGNTSTGIYYATNPTQPSEPLFSLRLFPEGFFIRLPDGYYSFSKEAYARSYYTQGLRSLEVRQLDLKYNRPDIVYERLSKLFQRTDTQRLALLRKAYYKRVARADFDTALLNGQIAPPAVYVSLPGFKAHDSGNRVTVAVKASMTKRLLARFQILVNGVAHFPGAGIMLRRKSFDTLVQIPLEEGLNKIDVRIQDAAGLENFREPVWVQGKRPATAPKLFFIGIGIDRYRDSGQNLKYSVKDIRDLATALASGYKERFLADTFFNENVQPSILEHIKHTLSLATIYDKVILAYSGHGLLNVELDYYLATNSVNFLAPGEGGLPFEAMRILLASCSARKRLMLVDACHSGEVDRAEFSSFSKRATGAKGIEIPSLPGKAPMGLMNSFEMARELFVQDGLNDGTVVIAAASGTQFAYERGQLNNGVFTYAVLNYLKQPLGTVSGLEQVVRRAVSEMTGGLQQPTSRAKNYVVDWRLW